MRLSTFARLPVIVLIVVVTAGACAVAATRAVTHWKSDWGTGNPLVVRDIERYYPNLLPRMSPPFNALAGPTLAIERELTPPADPQQRVVWDQHMLSLRSLRSNQAAHERALETWDQYRPPKRFVRHYEATRETIRAKARWFDVRGDVLEAQARRGFHLMPATSNRPARQTLYCYMPGEGRRIDAAAREYWRWEVLAHHEWARATGTQESAFFDANRVPFKSSDVRALDCPT